jgi:death-on-curing protein
VTLYLGIETALRIIELNGWQIRDLGLLDSAMHRPQAQMFGQEAYGSLDLKAAALLHSIVANHCLVDGNKRLGWLCANVFLRLNGDPCMLSDDDAVFLVLAVAEGSMREVAEIAVALRKSSW